MKRKMTMGMRISCVMAAFAILLVTYVASGAQESVPAAAAARQIPIYSVGTEESKVALGINCAWDDHDVDALLATLKEKDVKATFFLVGSFCRQFPEAVAKIAEAGHELASHSNTHPDMTKLDRDGIMQQLNDSRDAIAQITGEQVSLFRAPSGAYNNLVVQTARAQGWEVVQWDNDTLDWKGVSPDELVKNGTRHLQNGSILLLHSGAKYTSQALSELIDTIRAKGYSFESVGELVLPKPYTVDHTGRQFAASGKVPDAKRAENADEKLHSVAPSMGADT